jgi:hypothetical protein
VASQSRRRNGRWPSVRRNRPRTKTAERTAHHAGPERSPATPPGHLSAPWPSAWAPEPQPLKRQHVERKPPASPLVFGQRETVDSYLARLPTVGAMWSGSGPRSDQKAQQKATASLRLPAAKSTASVLSSLVLGQVSACVEPALCHNSGFMAASACAKRRPRWPFSAGPVRRRAVRRKNSWFAADLVSGTCACRYSAAESLALRHSAPHARGGRFQAKGGAVGYTGRPAPHAALVLRLSRGQAITTGVGWRGSEGGRA